MLTDADALAQEVEHLADATLTSVLLLMRQPDSPANRLAVCGLVQVLQVRVADMANTINWMAEQHGANWVHQEQREAMQAVVRAASS